MNKFKEIIMTFEGAWLILTMAFFYMFIEYNFLYFIPLIFSAILLFLNEEFWYKEIMRGIHGN